MHRESKNRHMSTTRTEGITGIVEKGKLRKALLEAEGNKRRMTQVNVFRCVPLDCLPSDKFDAFRPRTLDVLRLNAPSLLRTSTPPLPASGG